MDHGPAPFKEGMVSQFLQHVSLQHQFELRQKAFKPNMHVVEDAELYRVDAVIEERYIPPDEDNCVEMACFDLPKWQSHYDSDCV
jgi:hypothetical protein